MLPPCTPPGGRVPDRAGAELASGVFFMDKVDSRAWVGRGLLNNGG